MVFSQIFILALCIVSTYADCKTVTAQKNFNVDEYARATWYIHQQMAVKYLPVDQNYCVYAEYKKTTDTGLHVHNYANEGGVNGKVEDSDQAVKLLGGICAEITDANQPAKLSVGPCRLPTFTYGPYWIIAAGPTHDNYEYALVSGGQPTNETPNGCSTGTGINGSGLWIFSRSQERNETLVNLMRGVAKEQGFDISVLNNVKQAGCLYKPASKGKNGLQRLLDLQ